MFNLEEMKAKAESNGMAVQLFKHDSSGHRVYHNAVMTYRDAELWPFAFAERIDHLLEAGDVGDIYNMDTHGVWFAHVVAG